jgi:hypothetical protein
MKEKPNCYDCAHRREIPGDAHSRCNNHKAKVTGDLHGMSHGWFNWPLNFDPVWLKVCDGFSTDEKDLQAETVKMDPLIELFSMLR